MLDASIYSLQQLRSTTTKSLLSIKGFSDAKVNKIIDAAKKKIEWNSFVNATDILAKQSAAVPISTGSSDLDELLGGGIQTGCLTEIYGKYSQRRKSNVAAIIVRIILISSFFFYCLLLNHSFQTNPNRITNCFKLFSLFTTLQLHCSCVAF